MGLADRDYMRRRTSPGTGLSSHQKLFIIVSVSACLVAGFVWFERPDLFEAVGLPHAAQKLAFPASGTAAYADGRPNSDAAGYMVRDRSGDSLEKVIRFRTPESRAFVAELYLRPGDAGEIRLPPGMYRVHLTQGHGWRGPDVHFGAGAETYDMGVIAVGGDVDGVDILPRARVANTARISGTRF